MATDVIYNMDCFVGMKDLQDKSIDYVFTSPPYNRKRNDKYKLYDDTIVDYYQFLVKVVDELLRVCKNHVFFNIQTNYYNRQDVYKLIGNYSDKIQNVIVWEKSNPMPANGFNITNAFEYIIVFGDKPLKGKHTYIKNHITTSVNTRTMKQHKAIMNSEVANWVFDSFIPSDTLVLDPFMGSGTTAVVAKSHECRYLGYEIVKEYYSIALDRLK